MVSGRSLILKHRYREAIPLLEKAAYRFRADDSSRIRAALDLAVCHIAIGKFPKANELLDAYIVETRKRISLHTTYKAISHFLAGNSQDAVTTLLLGLKCTYQHDDGLDIPWMLYVFSVHGARRAATRAARKLIREVYAPIRAAEQRIAQVLAERGAPQPLDDLPDRVELISGYLLNEVSEEELRAGCWNVQGRNIKARRASNLAQLEFYVACKKLELKDDQGYRTSLKACLDVKGVDNVLIERVFAMRMLKVKRFGRPRRAV